MNDRCILLTYHSGTLAGVTAFGRLLLPATTGRTRPWQATTPSSPTSCWRSSWIPVARPLAGALPAWRLIRVLCEPTSSRTVLTWTAQKGRRFWWLPFMFQPATQGALPTLYAATSPQAMAGGYYGPRGLRGLRSLPSAAEIPANAQDTQAAASLWSALERLARVTLA